MRVGEVLEAYCAVMLCEPAKRVEVVNVAVLPESELVPMGPAPSKNVTVPVALVATVAVKATVCK
jgi:hypothetical protein